MVLKMGIRCVTGAGKGHRKRASKKGIEKDGIVCTERLIHNAEATTVSSCKPRTQYIVVRWVSARKHEMRRG